MASTAKAQELVDQIAKMMIPAVCGESNAGEKIQLLMVLGAMGITGVAGVTSATFNPIDNKMPNRDAVLFGALLTAECIELHQDGTCPVIFGPDRVLAALSMFEKLTGRSYWPQLNPGLAQVLTEQMASARQSLGENAKFLPN